MVASNDCGKAIVINSTDLELEFEIVNSPYHKVVIAEEKSHLAGQGKEGLTDCSD